MRPASVTWCWIIGIFAVCAGPAACAQEPKVRTSVAVKEQPWVGQKSKVVVELLAPGFFASAAVFDLPNVAGVIVVPPAESPVISNEEIDGASYTVQRHELAVYCMRAGEHVLPSFHVRFGFKQSPLAKQTVAADVTTEPITITARLPAGAEGLTTLISANDLQADDRWTLEPAQAKPGDAFTRTITFTAPDVPGMAFPPFPAAPIDGLGVYAGQPEVLDKSDRGQLTGQRKQTITYVCQRSGRFVIPAARLTWWDLDDQKLQTIDFARRVIEVQGTAAATSPPADANATRLKPTRGELAAIVGSLAAIAAAAWAAIHWNLRGRIAQYFAPIHLAQLNPRDS